MYGEFTMDEGLIILKVILIITALGGLAFSAYLTAKNKSNNDDQPVKKRKKGKKV